MKIPVEIWTELDKGNTLNTNSIELAKFISCFIRNQGGKVYLVTKQGVK